MIVRLASSVLLAIAAWTAPARALQQPASSSVGGDTVVLRLPVLVAMALRQNLDLRSARLGPRFATADFLSARGGFDRTLVVGAQQNSAATDVIQLVPRTTQSTMTYSAALATVLPYGSQLGLAVNSGRVTLDPYSFSASTPFPSTNSTNMRLTLTQPLLRGFGRSGTYGLVDAASRGVDASARRLDRGVDHTIATVERAFWTLREAEEEEAVAQASLEAARAIHVRNQQLRLRDLATVLDTVTSERAVAIRETQLMESTRLRVNAAEALLFLVYGEGARDAVVESAARVRAGADSLAIPAMPRTAEAEALALVARGDAMAARLELEASRRRAAQARSGRLPRIDLVAAYAFGGTSPAFRLLSYADSSEIRTSSWTLGLSASLFQSNSAARADDERAAAAVEDARLTLASVENAVRADVRAAVRAVEVARDRFARTQDVVRLAEQQYDAARESARLGLINTFQLLQYEGDLVQSRLQQAQVRFGLEDALTQYGLASGTNARAYGIARTPPEP